MVFCAERAVVDAREASDRGQRLERLVLRRLISELRTAALASLKRATPVTVDKVVQETKKRKYSPITVRPLICSALPLEASDCCVAPVKGSCSHAELRPANASVPEVTGAQGS